MEREKLSSLIINKEKISTVRNDGLENSTDLVVTNTKKKDVFDIFGYVDKKGMDIILSHVDNELEAVKGKLLCVIYCYVIIEQ